MKKNVSTRLYITWGSIALRVYLAYIFLYHGIHALFIEESWISLFSAVGFSDQMAVIVMPLVGLVDIAVGVYLLWRPNPYIALWAGFWPIVPSYTAYLAGETTLAHEISHVVPSLLAGGLLYILYSKKKKKYDETNH